MPRAKKCEVLTPPDSLEPDAVQEWNRIVSAVRATGHTLKQADRSMLMLCVKTWMVNQKAHEHVLQYGAVIKWPNGLPGTSPQYKVYIETGKQLQTMLAALGCTPASRDFDAVKAGPVKIAPLKF